MTAILIQNGRVIDPSQNMDRVTNLLIADGRIAAYDATADGRAEVLDATGRIVAPGSHARASCCARTTASGNCRR